MTPVIMIACLPILGAVASVAINLILPMSEAQVERVIRAA